MVAAAVVAAAVSAFHDDFFVGGVSTQTHFFLPNCNLENRFLSLFMKLAVFNLSYEKSDSGFFEKILPNVDLRALVTVFFTVFQVFTTQ
ncbi:hypothetical protein J5751_05355 [bacterium]|nr:hypothetical protein [bacterium]